VCKSIEGPKMYAKLIARKHEKITESAKCKHIIFICDLQSTYWKLGCIRFPNRIWYLILAFYNSKILHGFDHWWFDKNKVKQS